MMLFQWRSMCGLSFSYDSTGALCVWRLKIFNVAKEQSNYYVINSPLGTDYRNLFKKFYSKYNNHVHV